MAVKKSGLGKGLDSLIKDNSSVKKTAAANTSSENRAEEMKSGEQMMKINMVEPNRDQQEKNSKKMHCWNWQTPLSSLAYFSRC